MWDNCKVVITNCFLRRFAMTLRTGYTRIHPVAFADPLPTCLAILPSALSICDKLAVLQWSASGILSIFLQAIKKSCVSP